MQLWDGFVIGRSLPVAWTAQVMPSSSSFAAIEVLHALIWFFLLPHGASV